jgi:hypothetical protein
VLQRRSTSGPGRAESARRGDPARTNVLIDRLSPVIDPARDGWKTATAQLNSLSSYECSPWLRIIVSAS